MLLNRKRKKYSADLALLWNSQDGLISRVGPACTFASSGSVASGLSDGSLLPQNTLPVRTDSYGRKFVGNEPAYSNLIASENAALSSWTAGDMNVSGTRLTPNTTNIEHYVLTSGISVTSGVRYHLSVKCKAAGYNFVIVCVSASGGAFNNNLAWFNLGTGALGTVQSNVTASIEGPDSDGYYTCRWSAVATGTTSLPKVVLEPGPSDGFVAFAGDGTSGADFKEFILTSSYLFSYIAPGTSATSTAGTTGGNGQQWPMGYTNPKEIKLKDCFQGPGGVGPAVMTVAALVRKGVSSAELPNNTNLPIVSPNSSDVFLFSRKDGAGVEQLVRSNDGTTTVVYNGSWNRYEWHYLIVQTNSTGTQFRVGFQRLTEAMVPIGTDQITWNSWVVFDGSFNPLSALISALNTTVPGGLAHLQVWRKSASDAEIVREIRRKYPIGA